MGQISPKLGLGVLALAMILLINPSTVFAGNGPTFPDLDCEGDVPDAGLVTDVPGGSGIPNDDSEFFTYEFVADPDPDNPDTFPMLVFFEKWTSDKRSYIEVCNLEAGVNYQVKKEIVNDAGEAFNRFQNELLDPCCDELDEDDMPPEPYVTVLGPMGCPDETDCDYSHSREDDGLSFAMGTEPEDPDVPRDSDTWSNIFEDEFGDVDFLQFDSGNLGDGETENMEYGLRAVDSPFSQQPFILTEIPNFGPRAVIGGEFLDIDTTAVLLAGAQMNAAWLIPLVVGMLAVGIIVARKLRY